MFGGAASAGRVGAYGGYSGVGGYEGDVFVADVPHDYDPTDDA